MRPASEDCGCAFGDGELGPAGAEPLRSWRLRSHHADWTFGDFDRLVQDRLLQLRALGVGPHPDGWGLDLGCGPGVSALALARLGLQVVAVDRCRSVLAELASHDSTRSVEVVWADIVDFAADNTRRFDVIVCGGDAIPHLPSRESVERLLRHLPRALQPGGRALLAFRDHTRAGPGRHFVRLHQDAERGVTRVLDAGPERVQIHDLLHERRGLSCALSVRHATALRLDPGAVGRVLGEAGLEVSPWDCGPGCAGWVARRAA